MIAIKINNEIQLFPEVPNVWGQTTNFKKTTSTKLKQIGFYPVEIPVYNPETEYLGTIYFDEINKIFTYPINQIETQ